MLQAQNVGIGNTNPQAKLDITGNIKIADGTQGDGKVLTSNATGVATWQKAAAAGPGAAGFGTWGDCATNANISDYNPISPDDLFNGSKLGNAVSVSGDFAAVGTGYSANAVYIYKYNAATSVWDFYQKIVGPVISAFGQSICMDGNNLIIGAFDDVVSKGSANIYKNIAGVWTFQVKLLDNSPNFFDKFGRSVSMSGDYAIVGSSGDDDVIGTDQGSASIYKNIAGTWTLQIKLLENNPAVGNEFGWSVSINGDNAIISSIADDDAGGIDQGSVSIYKNIAGVWTFQTKLFNTAAAPDDLFGISVSINGDYAMVGCAFDDDVAGADQGSASIYKNIAGVWTLQTKLLKQNAGINDYFGVDVCVNADYIIVGSPADDDVSGIDQGTASIYKRLGNTWQRYQFLLDPAGNTKDNFGFRTAIEGSAKRFLIGAPTDSNTGKGKVVLVK